jgi:hypothetical protein
MPARPPDAPSPEELRAAARHDRIRRAAPRWLIVGLAVNLVFIAVMLVVTVSLLNEHSTLLHKYDEAATSVDNSASVISHDLALLCKAEHVQCKGVAGP